MRAVFSILSLLIVVAIIGVLAKKQLSGGPARPVSSDAAVLVPVPVGTPQQQTQQFKQSLENSMQQARPMPEDK